MWKFNVYRWTALVTDKLDRIRLYRVHLAWAWFELATLVVIGTDCICSYKSNYHTFHFPVCHLDTLYNHVTSCSCRNYVMYIIRYVNPATFGCLSSVLLVEETGVPRVNHRPVTSHWQYLSHYVVLSIPRHERSSNSQL
jgi:hypothetical protein